MKYYIQISLWFLSALHLNVTPLRLTDTYKDGTPVYVIPISYVDSISSDLHNWVDSTKQYPVITDTARERINIVHIDSTHVWQSR